jgi:hypothetical protein
MNRTKPSQEHKPLNAYPDPPEAIELAKLAALLSPSECLGEDAREILEKARDLYMAAVAIVLGMKKFPEDRSRQYLKALERLGFGKEVWEVIANIRDLKLYSKKQGGDQVKSYLKEKGIKDCNTTRVVRENIKRYFVDQANAHNRQFAETIAHPEKSPEGIVWDKDAAPTYHSPEEITWKDAEQLISTFWESALPQALPGKQAAVKPRKKRSPEYWLISPDFLDKLIEWRRKMKREGRPLKAIKPLSKETGSRAISS